MKGADGVFCWDLNGRPEITPGEVEPTQTEFAGNMRVQYDEWYRSMSETERGKRSMRARSRFLLGVTRPKNLQNWSRLTNNLLLKQLPFLMPLSPIF